MKWHRFAHLLSSHNCAILIHTRCATAARRCLLRRRLSVAMRLYSWTLLAAGALWASCCCAFRCRSHCWHTTLAVGLIWWVRASTLVVCKLSKSKRTESPLRLPSMHCFNATARSSCSVLLCGNFYAYCTTHCTCAHFCAPGWMDGKTMIQAWIDCERWARFFVVCLWFACRHLWIPYTRGVFNDVLIIALHHIIRKLCVCVFVCVCSLVVCCIRLMLL